MQSPSTSTDTPAGLPAPELLRVLKALSLQRAAGWHLPAYYLGIAYESVSREEARMTMDLDGNTDSTGQLLPVSLCILADVALAAAIRGTAGFETRMATISARICFTGHSGRQALLAKSHTRFLSNEHTLKTGNSAAVVLSGDIEICFAEANFAILDNLSDIPALALPGRKQMQQIELLEVNDLSDQEKLVYERAQKAGMHSASDKNTTFTERFWQLVPTTNGSQARCEVTCGLHIGNRVGHVQGGILLGLAIQTSLATLGEGWRILEINASFIRPGTEGTLTASSYILNEGRNLAQTICEIKTSSGRLVLQAQSTMIKK